MKYIIDETVCKKHHLELTDTLCLLFLKSCGGEFSKVLERLKEEGKVALPLLEFAETTDNLYITPRWDDELCGILLESDASVPSESRIVNLVTQMRELFPKGMKINNSAWRGNVRELKLRMQKFFKMYGDYPDEDILKATKSYVDSFNGDYTFMRILKYFILKSEIKQHQDENGEIVSQVEDISILANILDNPDTEIVKRTRLV